jgi:hypothetical protein
MYCLEEINKIRSRKEKFGIDLASISQDLSIHFERSNDARIKGNYSDSVECIAQAQQLLITTLSQLQGTSATNLQMLLLEHETISFQDLMSQYEQKYNQNIDESVLLTLLQLLKERKVHGKFSI